jgi:uncharacterized protein
VHIPLAIAVAATARLNVAVLLATVMLVNPLTAVPVYYLAYRIGAAVLGRRLESFEFALSWDWLQHGLGPLWQPFLVGCLVCGASAFVAGWVCSELLWRLQVVKKYRQRRSGSSG